MTMMLNNQLTWHIPKNCNDREFSSLFLLQRYIGITINVRHLRQNMLYYQCMFEELCTILIQINLLYCIVLIPIYFYLTLITNFQPHFFSSFMK